MRREMMMMVRRRRRRIRFIRTMMMMIVIQLRPVVGSIISKGHRSQLFNKADQRLTIKPSLMMKLMKQNQVYDKCCNESSIGPQ